jgi:hypothetical protein
MDQMSLTDMPDKPGHRQNVRGQITRTDADTPLRGVQLSGVRSRKRRRLAPGKEVKASPESAVADDRPYWVRCYD